MIERGSDGNISTPSKNLSPDIKRQSKISKEATIGIQEIKLGITSPPISKHKPKS